MNVTKYTALVFIFTLTACAALVSGPRVLGNPEEYMQMTDQQLWDAGFARQVGACRLEDARQQPTECRYYLKIDGAKWLGQGWPVDARTNSGTGCAVMREKPQTSIGPTPEEFKGLIGNLRNAIADPANPCRLLNKDLVTSNL